MTLNYSGMINTSFNSCGILLSHGGLYNKNSYSDCDFLEGDYWYPFSPTKVINSNLINCGLITINASRSDYEEIDMTGNFWGYDKTREMTEKGVSSNLSFIHDYYDDFNKTKVVYSDYLNEPIEGVGYLGDAYYPVVAESPTVYQVGDTGPAGGKVFYDKGFYSEGWRYLEAAPADLDGRIIFGFYKATANSNSQKSGTSPCIGAGRTNTRMLVDTMGDLAYTSYVQGDGTREADYAAKLCQDLSFNGFDDWFLPSSRELRIMYNNLKRNGLGDFDDDWYWTSNGNSVDAGYMSFYDGWMSFTNRGFTYKVRPVRAF